MKTKFIYIITGMLFVFISNSCTHSFKDIKENFEQKVNIKQKIAYLKDDRFPELTKEQLKESISHTRKAIASEFETEKISFADIRIININDYFDKVIGDKENKHNTLDPFNPVFPPMSKKQEQFFSTYDLESLKEFVPEAMRPEIKVYEDFYNYLCSVWKERIDHFTSLKVDGTPAFTKETLAFQTFSGWLLLFEHQTEYDFFLTNTLIFYDFLDAPSPHTISKHAKLGGYGGWSLGAPNGAGRAALASTVSFSGIPYFSETDVTEALAPEVLAVYLIAHEIGHMIFQLPDVYDHPLHCLMNTPPENSNFLDAVTQFKTHQEPCPMCAKDLAAGKFYWLNR